RYRFTGRRKFALGIIGTAVENISPPPRLFLDQLALFALRTFHPDEILFHVLALGIAAAGGELAIPPVTQHHSPSALWTVFIQRDVGNFLSLVEAPRGLAIRVPGTGHELPEAPALQHHRTTAVLAVFLLRSLLHVGRIEIGQVNRIFLGERAAVGIILLVRTARVE